MTGAYLRPAARRDPRRRRARRRRPSSADLVRRVGAGRAVGHERARRCSRRTPPTARRSRRSSRRAASARSRTRRPRRGRRRGRSRPTRRPSRTTGRASRSLGFFVGQVMKATRGQANAALVQAAVRERLDGGTRAHDPVNVVPVGRGHRPDRGRLHAGEAARGRATRRSRSRTRTRALRGVAGRPPRERTTGASVAMAILRRQAQIGGGDRDRRVRARLPRLPDQVARAARAAGGDPPRPDSRGAAAAPRVKREDRSA